MAFIKNFTPSNKSLRNRGLRTYAMLGFLFACGSINANQNYIPYTPINAAYLESRQSYWWSKGDPFYFPSKSRRIKNKIMRKRLCK